jgi:uncharacterized protein (TIGR02646 family)
MIKIDKTGIAVPTILSTKGSDETKANNTAYTTGQRKFSIKQSIYGHKEVKESLIALQNDKCCFCERKVSAGEPGHIEHFRPKGGYQKDEKSKLVKPGYYWLAYDFQNLFFSCNRCNSSYKRNYFPLVDETKRVTNHTGNLMDEDPLILSPADDTIASHLVFEQEIIKPKNRSLKGKETIKRTGLNRNPLVAERLTFLEPLKILAHIARIATNPESSEIREIRNLFKQCGKRESVFSYMVTCNFPDLI